MVADIQLPDFDGIELLKRIQNRGKSIPSVLITGHGSELLRKRAEELGAKFLEKPFNPAEFRDLTYSTLGGRLPFKDRILH